MCSEIDPTTSEGLGNLATGGIGLQSSAVGGPSLQEAGDKAKSLGDDLSGKTAADEAKAAAAKQADYQQQGLDYLMQTEEIPQALRQAGLQQLGGISGLQGVEQ
jgi:hypothetical protein